MARIVNCAFRMSASKCGVLTKKVCGSCPFHKTAEELQAGRDKAIERRKTLSRRVQREIFDKYYAKRVTDDE